MPEHRRSHRRQGRRPTIQDSDVLQTLFSNGHSKSKHVLVEADPHHGILRLDAWVKQRAAEGTLPEPPDSIQNFEELLRMTGWPTVISKSEAATLSDSAHALEDEAEASMPILPPDRYPEMIKDLEREMHRYLFPLQNIQRQCQEKGKHLKQVLEHFEVTPKNGERPQPDFPTGIHDQRYQNNQRIAELLSKYPRQVAEKRAAKRDHIDNVVIFDNMAMMESSERPTKLVDPATTLSDGQRGKSNERAADVKALPSVLEYEQPVKSELISGMKARSFKGLQLPNLENQLLVTLPFNLSAKYVLRAITSLQQFPSGFPLRTWKAVFHGVQGQQILALCWWWFFIQHFCPMNPKPEAKQNLLLRLTAKASRIVREQLSFTTRDQILELYPDGMAQALFLSFNELFPFHREHFCQPYFLSSLEIHLYGWLSGTLAAVSEHYQFLWRQWSFEYMDLTKIRSEHDYPRFFHLKLKTADLPQTSRVDDGDERVLDIHRFKHMMSQTIQGNTRSIRTERSPLPSNEETKFEKEFKEPRSVRHKSKRLELEEQMVVGGKLKFGELLMDFRHKKTPLIDLEFPPEVLTDAAHTFRKPMVITRVTDRYRSNLTYKAIAKDMQRGIQVRSKALRHLNREHTKQRKALIQRYWEKAGHINDLTVKIAAGHIRRNNVRELRLEVETAQEIGRHLPKNMQAHIKHGSLPPLIELQTAQNLLTHSEHKALPLATFVGSYYDPVKRTKLTGWDRIQKRIQGVQAKADHVQSH